MIFIATKIFVTKTYCHRVYYNGLQRLTFAALKVYCTKIKVITTKNFIAINLFCCIVQHFLQSNSLLKKFMPTQKPGKPRSFERL